MRDGCLENRPVTSAGNGKGLLGARGDASLIAGGAGVGMGRRGACKTSCNYIYDFKACKVFAFLL